MDTHDAASPLDRVKAMYDGIDSGDFNPFLQLLAEDVRWHLPGTSPFAGTTESRDALVTRLLQQSQQAGGTVRIEWRQGMGDGDLVVVLERLRATAGDESLDVGAVVVYRFEGGVVVEAWDVFDDQAAYDRFWTATAP